MASAINKRQQARNERTLQDLIKNVPGNDRCADCFARNPGWASWSLGIFLCMRCAALHRKLGTHVSKVKSLSMDTWAVDQVDHMKKTGNIVSNRIYNPRNVKPNIPVDVDEVDSAMERFMREKYQHRTLSEGENAQGNVQRQLRRNTGSSDNLDDVPPPLPPKKNGIVRFGASLRAASSTYPTHRMSPLPTPPSPLQTTDSKLGTLRDMGFSDDKRNSNVLKGVGGNLDRAVESLVRLGEGSESAQMRARSQMQPQARPQEPRRPPRFPSPEPQGSGAHIQQAPSQASHTTNGPTPLQQTPASQPPPLQNPYNPFNVQTQPTANGNSLEQSFQNMTMTPPQPLFPHSTGSWSVPGSDASGSNTNPFLKSFTPPVTPSPYQQQYQPQQQNVYQPAQQTPQYTGAAQRTNPFLRTSRSQNFATTNPFGQSVDTAGMSSVYDQQNYQNPMPPVPSVPNWAHASAPQSPAAFFGADNVQNGQQYHSYQPQVHSPLVQSPGGVQYQSGSLPPFEQAFQQQNRQAYASQPQHFAQQQQHTQQQQQQFAQSSFAQPGYMQSQQTGRYDKNSILALYNTPHLASHRPFQDDPSMPATQNQMQHLASAPALPQTSSAPRRSVTMPASGALNPFAGLAPAGRGNGIGAHVSQESVDFSGLMSGRHSPDAFSGLSSRMV